MNTPLNQEHKEAEQFSYDQKREQFIATLSKKEQAQFKAVQKAVETLVKAKIPFYLFPMLPSMQFEGKNQVWQWNSLAALTEYDSKGVPTEESKNRVTLYHEAFFAFFFNQYHEFFNGKTMEEKLSALPFFIYRCLVKHQQYLNGETNEETPHD